MGYAEKTWGSTPCKSVAADSRTREAALVALERGFDPHGIRLVVVAGESGDCGDAAATGIALLFGEVITTVNVGRAAPADAVRIALLLAFGCRAAGLGPRANGGGQLLTEFKPCVRMAATAGEKNQGDGEAHRSILLRNGDAAKLNGSSVERVCEWTSAHNNRAGTQ